MRAKPDSITLNLVVMVQDRYIRICVDRTQVTIKDQGFPFPEQVLRKSNTKYSRNAQAVGEYGCVAVGPAMLSYDTSHAAFMKNGEFAWCQFGGDDHGFSKAVGDVL